MRYILILIVFLIYGLLNYYLGWNLKKWLTSLHLFKWKWLYWTVFFLLAFSMFIGRIHESLFVFRIISNYWMFLFEYGLIFCIIANLIYVVSPFKNVKVIGSVIVSCVVILFIWGTYNAYTPVVRNLQITVDKPGEPMRVVVASDFHIGLLSSKKHLEKFVELSNKAKPDLVLLVGDIIDDEPSVFIDKNIGDVLNQLQSTYGVYGVLGNHEYYGGQIPLFVKEIEKANVRMLLDETILIDNRLYLTGREDLTNDNRLALESLKPDNEMLPWIVMNHNPNDLNEPKSLGVDLHLSGHTHRGQLFPNNLLTNIIYEVDYGYKLIDSMHALVSSGFGFWGPPMRIGSQSELWIVDIQFEN